MDQIRLENFLYLKFLLGIPGIGTQKIISLLPRFNTLTALLNANYERLANIEGINKILTHRLLSAKHDLEKTKIQSDRDYENSIQLKSRIITYLDSDYPVVLRSIYLPPLILYVKGNILPEDETSIAVVGTRQPSNYGISIAEKISKEIVEKKITIISGLARGIDSVAHAAALKFGGRTIAVIGSGLDVIYPPENKKLFEKICSTGAVVSEYEPGTKPDAQNFPRRNRIISGLSLGTVIIETRINGGAMQTAAYALDQGKEVFAIPGNLNSKQSEGPNTLIQKGEAKLVTCIDDMLYELKLKLNPELSKNVKTQFVELNLFEEKVINSLSSEPKYIDDIALDTQLSTADCLVNLLTLEFKGLVKQLPGKMFVTC